MARATEAGATPSPAKTQGRFRLEMQLDRTGFQLEWQALFPWLGVDDCPARWSRSVSLGVWEGRPRRSRFFDNPSPSPVKKRALRQSCGPPSAIATRCRAVRQQSSGPGGPIGPDKSVYVSARSRRAFCPGDCEMVAGRTPAKRTYNPSPVGPAVRPVRAVYDSKREKVV